LAPHLPLQVGGPELSLLLLGAQTDDTGLNNWLDFILLFFKSLLFFGLLIHPNQVVEAGKVGVTFRQALGLPLVTLVHDGDQQVARGQLNLRQRNVRHRVAHSSYVRCLTGAKMWIYCIYVFKNGEKKQLMKYIQYLV
jgi:hypothetical protein